MKGIGDKAHGWWYRHGKNPSWSYSWTGAQGMKNYLGSSKSGLRGIQVSTPYELQIGDVICYDFDGDGHWQHNSIVVGFDAVGAPLINTHTYSRYYQPWDLTNSPAATSRIQYVFYRIVV